MILYIGLTLSSSRTTPSKNMIYPIYLTLQQIPGFAKKVVQAGQHWDLLLNCKWNRTPSNHIYRVHYQIDSPLMYSLAVGSFSGPLSNRCTTGGIHNVDCGASKLESWQSQGATETFPLGLWQDGPSRRHALCGENPRIPIFQNSLGPCGSFALRIFQTEIYFTVLGHN